MPHVHDFAQELMNQGKRVVVFEGAWGRASAQDDGWSFVCVVDESVRVPKELGREAVFANSRPGVNVQRAHIGEVPFKEGFVGYITYEGEPHFVYAREVHAFRKSLSEELLSAPPSSFHLPALSSPHPHPQISKKEYAAKLAVIKEKLLQGETYQVNFSVPFSVPFYNSAWEAYKKISTLNPSPYQFFMDAVISNSPECLFRLDANGRIITRPIKGTVPRGATPEEDDKNKKKLIESEKDRAELAMIVDLERNDLGKICTAGTVHVTHEREVEMYSHVIHTVATIEGQLEKGKDWYDAVQALFPGGSVTGCPKKRTMEIIAQLEDAPRGVYCGSAGWIDVSGAAEFNILIRTAWLDTKNHILSYRAGGGIVADSQPQKEYEEVLQKARALASI